MTTFTKEEAAAFVADLDEESRTILREALLYATGAANDAAMLDKIRGLLARKHPGQDVIGVVFTTMEFDNGYFLTDDGEIFFADGETDNAYFEIDDLLTEEYGACGEKAALAVNLRTGEYEFDTYGDQVYAWLGVKKG